MEIYGAEVKATLKMAKEAVFEQEYDNGNSGANKTIDWRLGNKQKLTLTANCTLTFTNPSGCTGGLTLRIVQGGAGSYTVAWPSNTRWPEGQAPTLTSGVGRVDIVGFYFDGTYYYGIASTNFLPAT